MILLPTLAAAVAAAAAAAHAHLPHRHRAASCAGGRQRLLARACSAAAPARCPALAGRSLPRSAWSVSLLLGPMGPVRSASVLCRGDDRHVGLCRLRPSGLCRWRARARDARPTPARCRRPPPPPRCRRPHYRTQSRAPPHRLAEHRASSWATVEALGDYTWDYNLQKSPLSSKGVRTGTQ